MLQKKIIQMLLSWSDFVAMSTVGNLKGIYIMTKRTKNTLSSVIFKKYFF